MKPTTQMDKTQKATGRTDASVPEGVAIKLEVYIRKDTYNRMNPLNVMECAGR